jgi:hypothetical protein
VALRTQAMPKLDTDSTSSVISCEGAVCTSWLPLNRLLVSVSSYGQRRQRECAHTRASVVLMARTSPSKARCSNTPRKPGLPQLPA